MTGQISQPGPIAAAEEGMAVLDSADQPVGSVTAVKMGDPEAITAQGQRPPGTVWDWLRDTFVGSEPEAPPTRAEQLLRKGYIKIDARGVFAKDLYADAEQIAHVDTDGVHLSVPHAELTSRS
nr:hypothetical protein [Kibdelosporangium sp. MJ126-NF4]CEL17569.1 hypothetical protein [Kibdelosporangium sp. MJ126-NF4]CTQ91204.1 hypothetical protein [Kibdelosporangium sp. MJ126-NF4]